MTVDHFILPRSLLSTQLDDSMVASVAAPANFDGPDDAAVPTNAATPADGPGDAATPADGPGDAATPADADGPGDAATPADADGPGDAATPADADGPDDGAVLDDSEAGDDADDAPFATAEVATNESDGTNALNDSKTNESDAEIEVHVHSLTESTPQNAQEYADAHTTRALKDKCRQYGLNATGKKIEMAARLLNHDASNAREPIVILDD